MNRQEDSSLLIVDDSAITRRKLRQILEQEGYRDISETSCGEDAVSVLQERTFDLFLLDVLMPGMDGLALCRHIKSDPRCSDSAVLFVTGSMDLDSRWECFEAGGVDYIPKPFHPRELLNRVQVHLQLILRNRENRCYAEQMEDLAEERARQLLHAERLGTLGVLTAGIVHEIRNGISMVDNNAQMMEKVWPEFVPILEHAFRQGYERSPKTDIVLESFHDGIQDIRAGINRISDISHNVLRFARKADETETVATNLEEVIEQSLMITHNRLKYRVDVIKTLAQGLPPVWARTGPLSQVFVNLILNAADATEGREEAILRIEAMPRGDSIVCHVEDNGCGMDQDTLSHLWDPFFTTKKDKGTGLGMNLSKRILEDFGGSIEVASTPGKGTTFTITLRIADSKSENRPLEGDKR